MKVDNIQTNNTYVNLSDNNTKDESDSSAKKTGMDNGVVFAGNLNLNNETIEDKKQQAQKQALKKIMDQFKNEMKSDDNISSLRDSQTKYKKDMDDAAEEYKTLENQKQSIKDSYGVSDDSTEQTNLDLVERSIFHPEEMTEDDYNQLKDVGSLTDYQKEALQVDASEQIWKSRIDNAANGIHSVDQAITGIKLGKLKSHPMVDAQKQALDIINNANEEIASTLMQQVKDKVDDTVKENKDKAEKEQKEKEDKEKAADNSTKTDNSSKTDNYGNKIDNNDSKTTDINNTGLDQTDQQQLIDNIKRAADKQKMLEDDIKGIVVDEQV